MHITEKQLRLISEIASREAIKAHQENLKQEEKARRDRRLKNIKLLLRNYRNFKKHCEDIKLEIDELNDRLTFVTVDSEEFKLESILRSKERTLIMVRYVDRMIMVYKTLCESSDNPEDMRQFRIIHDLYISDDRMSVKFISKRENVAERTVYRDVDKACKTLASLMFGLDGVRFN